ncbi:MAG TPA: hypothetical protein K8W17_06135 [Lapidilactobacillus dextrinicus]|uniref:Uncharacterized protein n=1 Tax=Lapidilactobacillus dextrinicus TaxID=51664 RepID=A0A921B4M8_9LACO|nr:hypothetical protein [Lapidilactobacillus dextrinicus]
MAKVIDIKNYQTDRVAHAFLEFYLSLFKNDELDSLATFDTKDQMAEINHFLELAPQVTNDQLIEKLVEARNTELTGLVDKIVAAEPAVTELTSSKAWHDWYQQLIKKIAVRTPGSSWNKYGTR